MTVEIRDRLLGGKGCQHWTEFDQDGVDMVAHCWLPPGHGGKHWNGDLEWTGSEKWSGVGEYPSRINQDQPESETVNRLRAVAATRLTAR